MNPGTSRRSARLLLCAVLLVPALRARAQAPTFDEFSIPTARSGAGAIALGRDGALYFVEESGNRIGRVTEDGVVTETWIPTPGARPYGIAAGPDGNVWFTEYGAGAIGRVAPGSGFVREFAVTLPSGVARPSGITGGPDGNVWFTESASGAVGRITPAGEVTLFPLPSPGAQPGAIVPGPDGNLWFLEVAGNRVGRITPAGEVTEFPIPTPASGPSAIAPGPDGALWFTEESVSRVGRVTMAGAIGELPLPSAGRRPAGIAAGRDGNLWVTEYAANRVARMTLAGDVTEFGMPSPSSGPRAIVPGPPEANLWILEYDGNRVARMTVPGAGACVPDGQHLCLFSGRFRVSAKYVDYAGHAGSGTAVPLTSDTGTFWFFSPANVEAVVKMVPFCSGSATDAVAVYATGLTDLGVTFTVTDTKKGLTKTYVNELGTPFRLLRDGPFACSGSLLPPPPPEPARPEPLAASCAPDASTLCLLSGRFLVTAEYRDYGGDQGVGKAVPLTSDTGYFWFFTQANVEAVVKLVGFCEANGKYAVYANGLTDLGVTLHVTDTVRGTRATWENTLGNAFTLIREAPFDCP